MKKSHKKAWIVGGVVVAGGAAVVGVYLAMRAAAANVSLPSGGAVHIQTGPMTVTTTPGQTLSFTLPSGATWGANGAADTLNIVAAPTTGTSTPVALVATANDTVTLNWVESGSAKQTTVNVQVNGSLLNAAAGALSTTPATPAQQAGG